MSGNLPYGSYNYPPNAQPSPYDVVAWLDVLAAQDQGGFDPRVYSDPQLSTQLLDYPQHAQFTQQPQFAQLPQYPPQPQAPYDPQPQYFHEPQFQPYPVQRSNSYPPAFQQGSSTSHQQQQHFHHHHASQHFYPGPQYDAPIEEEYTNSSVCSSPHTDPGSPSSSTRAKSKIALDPSQPLTVEGKPRERVFVACDRCRVRKLRCDGAKPSCFNCQRVAGVKCFYDPTPKRRGQDRAPRTRSAVGQRKPRRPAVKKSDLAAAAASSTQRTP
ncbi:hypothetical protein L226DRAFT_575336 [Lentinus tigrinus ALCF2SS1-7]|nr:hypothetical protein L226DRAFT_575336 [Lentinus tigrinus ALCF2SS1-7]